MHISIDLHVKCPIYEKWNKKKTPIFLFSWNFHTVFGKQITIFYQMFKPGSGIFLMSSIYKGEVKKLILYICGPKQRVQRALFHNQAHKGAVYLFQQ